MLDHSTDFLAWIGLMAAVAVTIARHKRQAWPLAVEAVLVVLGYYHMSCQELGTRHLPLSGISGRACRSKTHLAFTRWVGTGTLLLWHLVLIGTYARRG